MLKNVNFFWSGKSFRQFTKLFIRKIVLFINYRMKLTKRYT